MIEFFPKLDTSSGMSYVCSLCSKWLRAKDKGLDKCEASVGGRSCGGPMAGMVFPEYEGVLERADFASFCFVCGKPSTAGIRVPNEFRMLGVCEEHLKMFDRLEPVTGRIPLNINHVDIGKLDIIKAKES
jgi:hypothetical protein